MAQSQNDHGGDHRVNNCGISVLGKAPNSQVVIRILKWFLPMFCLVLIDSISIFFLFFSILPTLPFSIVFRISMSISMSILF